MSTAIEIEIETDTLNPLDNVEEIMNAHNWSFNRMTDEELMVEVKGQSCTYGLFFIWQEDVSALQFCCQYDLTINGSNLDDALKIVTRLNQDLWMGHFEISPDSGTPSFRQTCLYRGMQKSFGSEHIEDLVDISLAQCERYYPVFAMLAQEQQINDQTLSLAAMQTQGES